MSRDFGYFETQLDSNSLPNLVDEIVANCEDLGWTCFVNGKVAYTKIGEDIVNWNRYPRNAEGFSSLVKDKLAIDELFSLIISDQKDDYQQIELQVSNGKVRFCLNDSLKRVPNTEVVDVGYYMSLIIGFLKMPIGYGLVYKIYVDR